MTLPQPNIEFLQLMQDARWSAAETSRRINVSEGLLSMYKSGAKSPPERTLDLLRMKVRDHLAAEASRSKVPELRDAPMLVDFDDLLHEINEIKERVYALERKVQTARAAARDRATAAAVSSKLPPDFGSKIGKALGEAVARGGGGSSPSGGVDGPNAPAHRPPDRTGQRYSSRQSPPGEVPKSREDDKAGDHRKK